MSRVVIVGGGITGLAAAHALQAAKKKGASIEFVLLEKGDRLGGVIMTQKVDGFVVEGGPDCFISAKPMPIELSREIGIEDQLVCTNEENKGTYVLSGTKLHALPDGLVSLAPTRFWPFVTSGLISWPGKLRMGLEYFIAPRYDGADESLASFVKRRVGREVLEKVAEPLIAGIHGSDPETMSVRSTFPRFIEMEEKYGGLTRGMLAARRAAGVRDDALFGAALGTNSGTISGTASGATSGRRAGKPVAQKWTFFVSFKEGMQQLTDRLAASLSRAALLQADVVSLEERRRPAPGETRYELALNDGTRVAADAVIVAAPAHAAADIVEPLDGMLASRLREIPYVSSATVSLAYRVADLPKPLKGFGFVVPSSEQRTLMAMTWSSSKWPGRAPEGQVLVRAFVGGVKNEGYAALGDKTLLTAVTEDLRDVTGLKAEPLFYRIFRWPKAMPQYTIGHQERVAAIEQRVAAHPGLYVIGGAYRGVGVGDCIREGKTAASRALSLLK